MSKAKYQGYEQLESILNEALEQAAAGKGKERHANERAFEDQPMQLISKLLDDNHGLAFQAIKKVQESLRLPDDRAERELLGAINYIAGMIIFLREAAKSTPHADELTHSKVKPALRYDVIRDALFLGSQETCPYCGSRHHAWNICPCRYPSPLRTDSAMKTTTSAGPVQGDTVPLKQYNDLLAQYTQLERRLQELN